jgi:hypothetical protein
MCKLCFLHAYCTLLPTLADIKHREEKGEAINQKALRICKDV